MTKKAALVFLSIILSSSTAHSENLDSPIYSNMADEASNCEVIFSYNKDEKRAALFHEKLVDYAGRANVPNYGVSVRLETARMVIMPALQGQKSDFMKQAGTSPAAITTENLLRCEELHSHPEKRYQHYYKLFTKNGSGPKTP